MPKTTSIIHEARQKALSAYTIQSLSQDFKKLGLKDAQDVARTWLKRAGKSEANIDAIEEIDDMKVLLDIMLQARCQYIESGGYIIGKIAIRIDEAAANVDVAIKALEEEGLEVPGGLRDAMGLLAEGYKQVTS